MKAQPLATRMRSACAYDNQIPRYILHPPFTQVPSDCRKVRDLSIGVFGVKIHTHKLGRFACRYHVGIATVAFSGMQRRQQIGFGHR